MGYFLPQAHTKLAKALPFAHASRCLSRFAKAKNPDDILGALGEAFSSIGEEVERVQVGACRTNDGISKH